MRQKKSKTDIYVLLGNLKRFVNDVPIDPKSPTNYKAWEKDRRETKDALDEAEETIRKLDNLDDLGVFIKDCRKILPRQASLDTYKKV